MSPPINIDGTNENYSSVTIDGQTVEQITIDGQDVLSTIPDSVEYQIDARNLSGFSDGDTVSTWPATVGNDMTATNTPSYQSSAINGNPAVVYDDSNPDHHDVTFSSAISEKYTAFMVYQHTDSNNFGVVFSTSSNQFPYTANDTGQDRYLMSAGSTATGGSPTTDPELMTIQFTGDPNSLLRVNGTQVINEDVGSTTDIGGYRVGVRGDDNNPFQGPVGFGEIHSGDPSNGLLTREQEIADEWGITL